MKNCPFCAEDSGRGHRLQTLPTRPCGSSPVLAGSVASDSPPSGESAKPGVAAVLSLVIPGAGQLYRGRLLSGLVWFVCVVMGYAMLIVPGIILHLCCIVAAASGSSAQSRGVVVSQGTATVGTTTVAPLALSAQSNDAMAKSLGRALAILVNPAATWRSKRPGAKVFLVVVYAWIALYVVGFIGSRL